MSSTPPERKDAMTLKWVKICPGLYRAKVGPEFWQEFTAEKMNEEFGYLCGMWRITYPTYMGFDHDDVWTFRECKEIAYEYIKSLEETR
jgi:hypothetical protein